jgi:SPP1 family phage portal protein
MTTGYITLTHLVNAKLMADKATLDTARLKDLIESDAKTPAKVNMANGVRYYDAQHDILRHRNTYFLDGVEQTDTAKSNARIPHPFHRILVDQKIAYLIGKPLVMGVAEPDIEDPEAPTPAEQKAQGAADEFRERLLDQIGNHFDDLLNEWAKGACNKGVEWLHFYVDEDGGLQYCLVPAEQVIAVYDTQYQQRLMYVVRFYVYDIVSEQGEVNQRYKVEWWSKDAVEYWQQQLDGVFVHDPFYEQNPAPHWSNFNTHQPGKKEPHGWGRPPFVRLDNNGDARTDLEPVKPLIDAYDMVKSGWANDLVDFQELVYVLRGYAPLSAELKEGLSELAAFTKNLKTQKVISVSSEGGVDTLSAEIPVEAKEKFLALTRKEIFFFGEGVDVDADAIQSPSGIALKFLYTSLDLKASRLERKFKKALTDFMYFVVQHINDTEGTAYDYTEVTFTFNKSVIFNEKEKIDAVLASDGLLSKRTVLANHPFVDDVDEEMARLDTEKQERLDAGMVELGDVQPDATGVPGTMVDDETADDGTPPDGTTLVPAKKNGKVPAAA